MSYFQVFFISMLPVSELRGAIPAGLFLYKLPLIPVFWVSVLGNILPVIFILLFLEKLSDFLSNHFEFFDEFFKWLFERTRKNYDSKVKKFKEFSLFLLVAIPLPLTGAWTGSLVAFVFGFSKRKSFLLISLGVVVAAVIVSALSLIPNRI